MHFFLFSPSFLLLLLFSFFIFVFGGRKGRRVGVEGASGVEPDDKRKTSNREVIGGERIGRKEEKCVITEKRKRTKCRKSESLF